MNPLQRTFSLLTEADVTQLEERIARRAYRADDIILREGDRTQKLFIVLKGKVRIEKSYMGASIPIAELDEGELFGEISFVDSSGASASVVADGPCEIGEIDATQVNALLAASPAFSSRFYHSLAFLLSKRLRQTTQSIMPGMFSS